MLNLSVNKPLFPTADADSIRVASRSPSEPALPLPRDDIFADERANLQGQARAIMDDATQLRRQLVHLGDRAERLAAYGGPPAFVLKDDPVLAWLHALPCSVLRTLQPAGTAMERAVAQAVAKFGPQRISVGPGMSDVVMRLCVAAFSPRQLRALGLREGGVLTLAAHFEPEYHLAPEPPALTIEHSAPSGTPQVATSAVTGARHNFRLGYQMLNILTRALQEAWATGAPTERVLTDLFSLAERRLATLPQHCVVCDQALPGAQLRPTPCRAPDCISQAETWGYGFEPQEIAQNPEVADLLISMTAAAANVGRDAYFKRLPMAFRLSGVTDFVALTREIDSIPPVPDLVAAPDMIGMIDAVSPTALSSLSWLMVSNEGFLEFIPPHQQYQPMNTPYQFRIFGGPLEREQAFLARPDQHKNHFAFHGSPFGNWHSILRTGLVVGGSDTGLGFNGAAYGPGVYVSNNSSTSSGYSHSQTGWSHSMFGNAPMCLSLCETNGPSVRGLTAISSVDVFRSADAVALRYLFVYGARTIPHVTAEAAARWLKSHAGDSEALTQIKRGRRGWFSSAPTR